MVRLVLEVMGDRTSKFVRNKADGHVQNSGPAITNRVWSWADQSGDWLGDHALKRVVQPVAICWWFHI